MPFLAVGQVRLASIRLLRAPGEKLKDSRKVRRTRRSIGGQGRGAQDLATAGRRARGGCDGRRLSRGSPHDRC